MANPAKNLPSHSDLVVESAKIAVRIWIIVSLEMLAGCCSRLRRDIAEKWLGPLKLSMSSLTADSGEAI
jgi:hypothetical protein